MPKALVIDVAGNQSIQILKTLKDYQKVVEGYIQIIPTRQFDAYCNEEGIMKEMFPNRIATDFIKEVLRTEGRELLMAGGSILGPVIIVGKPNGKGDHTHTPISNIVEWRSSNG